MLHPHALFDEIRQRLSTELDRHPPGAGRLYTLTLPLPELHLQSLHQTTQRWFYWGKPAEDEYHLGIGEALRISASGPLRLQRLAAAYRDCLARWDRIDPDHTGIQPVFFTGFAFSPDEPMAAPWNGLPNAGLFLPALLLRQRDNRCILACSCQADSSGERHAILDAWLQQLGQLFKAMTQRPGPSGQKTSLPLTHSEPSRADWTARVQQAQQDIGRGLLEKVVLSRQIQVRAQRPLNPVRLMATLDCLYPHSVLFATGQDQLAFAAATPELLLSCRDSLISSDALAGTMPRAADEARDRQLGEQLLQDPKSLHEHRLVIDTIRDALAPICSDIRPTARPRLKRLRGLQHLWTRIQGSLKSGTGLFEAAARLHPTAAVNGTPVQQACSWLQTHEHNPRGWYTGAAGWIDARGDGELAVLIRSALLQGHEAQLHAGAGITAGSDADAEYAETELKLAAMLEALENA